MTHYLVTTLLPIITKFILHRIEMSVNSSLLLSNIIDEVWSNALFLDKTLTNTKVYILSYRFLWRLLERAKFQSVIVSHMQSGCILLLSNNVLMASCMSAWHELEWEEETSTEKLFWPRALFLDWWLVWGNPAHCGHCCAGTSGRGCYKKTDRVIHENK